MPVLAIIPARMESRRLPGKVLRDLHGVPMLLRVCARVRRARLVDEVIVATDSEEVRAAGQRGGVHAVMTRSDHRSGSDRIAEVARRAEDFDLVLNVQGDQPLIDPDAIDALIDGLRSAPGFDMATLAVRLRDSARVADPNVVKVGFDDVGAAQYFTRRPDPPGARPFRHIGVYLFRRELLLRFADLAPSKLEVAEDLEQLRVLEAGHRILVVTTEHDCPGVDTEADLDRVRALLRAEHQAVSA